MYTYAYKLEMVVMGFYVIKKRHLQLYGGAVFFVAVLVEGLLCCV